MTKACTINADPSKQKFLQELSALSMESLALLAELSRKPGVEKKLQQNKILIKTFL